MHKLTFHCKTITPMFLAGADGRTPELRAPSIKGAMRFWWRAMNGHFSTKNLHKRESEIFGGTEKGQGRSKFSVNLINLPKETNFEYRPLPHSKHHKKQFQIPAIKPGSEFSVKFRTHHLNIKHIVRDLFIVTTILGSFGKRSRRGFGSIKLESYEDNGKRYSLDDSYDNLLSLLEEKLNSININDKDLFEKSNNSIESIIQNKSYPCIKKIEIGEEKEDINSILINIGEATHRYSWCEHLGFAKGKKRLASPIYVSVIKDKDKYYPIITTLNLVFPPNWKPRGEDKTSEFKKEMILK